MALSLLLAKVFGMLYTVAGLGMLINRAYYRKLVDKFATDNMLAFYGGSAALVTGMFMINFHNLWTGWEVIITLIGWLALIKGVLLILAPKAMLGMAKMFTKNDSVFVLWSVVALILGLVLCYFGFMA